MSSGRLAIAISLFNRWDELGGLLDLLRRNWKSGQDLFIAVTSTAPSEDVPSWIDQSLINHIEFGSPFPMPTVTILAQLEKISFIKQYAKARRQQILKRVIRSRTVDCIVRGCMAGMNSGNMYTLHLHAAAWPLFESKIYDLINRMEQGQYVFACRGYGKKWIDAKRPAGDIDDNFFVIQNEFARSTHFWDFDPARDAAHVTNEGRLARRVYEVCDEDKILFYDRFANPADYEFPPGADQRRIQPYNYFKPMGLLRSHDLRQQVRLCRELNIHGPVIDRLMKEIKVV